MLKKDPRKTKSPSLPALLKSWREARGLTKADAARKLDIPYRTLQSWELGERTPRGFALRAIMARLKVKAHVPARPQRQRSLMKIETKSPGN